MGSVHRELFGVIGGVAETISIRPTQDMTVRQIARVKRIVLSCILSGTCPTTTHAPRAVGVRVCLYGMEHKDLFAAFNLAPITVYTLFHVCLL